MLLLLLRGLFKTLFLLDPAADLFVIEDFAADILAAAPRLVCFKVLLAFTFKGALHAAGLARTCPLRGPYVHLNLSVGDLPGLLWYALVVISEIIIFCSDLCLI